MLWPIMGTQATQVKAGNLGRRERLSPHPAKAMPTDGTLIITTLPMSLFHQSYTILCGDPNLTYLTVFGLLSPTCFWLVNWGTFLHAFSNLGETWQLRTHFTKATVSVVVLWIHGQHICLNLFSCSNNNLDAIVELRSFNVGKQKNRMVI